MNSTSLQKHFPNIYRDFFARNDLVVSGAFNFPWTPSGVGNRSSYVSIKSKIPLKCYIGFKIKKEKSITFDAIHFYDITKNTFDTTPYFKDGKENLELIDFISNFLREHGFDGGVDISFLSETSRGHSFGFNGTSAAIIALGLFVLTGQIHADTLSIYGDFVKSEKFKLVESVAIRLGWIYKHGKSAGQNVRHALYNNSDPSFLLLEKNENIPVFDIEKRKASFVKIGENCKENLISTEIPMDYYMIFSGITTDSARVMNFVKGDEKKLKNYSKFINNFILGNEFQKIQTTFSPYQNSDDYIFNSLNENINILSIKMIEMFKDIFESGYNNAVIEDFIENINNYNHAVSLIERQSRFQEDFSFFFKKNIYSPEEHMGILPAYSGKFGGGYVIVTKQGISRNTIEKTINNLRSIYPNVEIEYCSYIDGECSDGIMVEQFISQGVYSQYVDKNKFLFRSNKGDNYIGDYSEIMDKEQDGILLDMINNKIYFNGEKLTSKDLPSQNTTIEVITRLLEHIGEELSNKDLPNSSYSSNKNEMLGKIILPLMKLIEEKTGEQIPLVCKGSLNDFYIKMGDVNIKIGAIKRI